MNMLTPLHICAALFTCLSAAVLIGMRNRRLLPAPPRIEDSRDAVKMAIGLVATMTAMLLGLLINSAMSTYDTQRTEIIQMAAKVTLLDRMLKAYGAEAADTRARFRDIAGQAIHGMWPEEAGAKAQLSPNATAAEGIYAGIQSLTPRDDNQRALKAQAGTLAGEIGELRVLLVAQAAPSIPLPLLIALGGWLVIIFFGFSLLAPPNAHSICALLIAAVSVVIAVLLILELDQPMSGMIRISPEPLMKALEQLGK
jgi:hypothetical protein